MPTAPANEFQLLALLLIILPGVVFEAVSTSFRGPSPTQRDGTGRVLSALAVSAALAVAYLPILGPLAPTMLEQARAGLLSVGKWFVITGVGALLLFGVPAGLALAVNAWRNRKNDTPVTALYDPTPSAWDFAFKRSQEAFIRVLLTDGTFVGGWFGRNSFAAGYPDDHELYLEEVYSLDEHGKFGEPTGDGVWISGAEIATLEIIKVDSVGSQEGTKTRTTTPTSGGDRDDE